MSENKVFAREEVFPSWFANRIQDYLSAGRMDLQLSQKSAGVVRVLPDSSLGIAAVNIEGRWRFITTEIERAVSGSKGTYTVWAVAEDNLVNNTPDPFTDHTNYKFELRITGGSKPTGEGTAISCKIGEVDWSGSAIERIRQTRGLITGAQIADAALGSGFDIEWQRGPTGALTPVLKQPDIGVDRVLLRTPMCDISGIGIAASLRFVTFTGTLTTASNVPNAGSIVVNPASLVRPGAETRFSMRLTIITGNTTPSGAKMWLQCTDFVPAGPATMLNALGSYPNAISGSLIKNNVASYISGNLSIPSSKLISLCFSTEVTTFAAETWMQAELYYEYA